jgi:hypothetical protein
MVSFSSKSSRSLHDEDAKFVPMNAFSGRLTLCGIGVSAAQCPRRTPRKPSRSQVTHGPEPAREPQDEEHHEAQKETSITPKGVLFEICHPRIMRGHDGHSKAPRFCSIA